MKLKLNTTQAGTPSQPTPGASATPTTAGGGLKLTFSKPAESPSTTEQQPQTPQQPKPKRKYTKKDPNALKTPKGKKREREDDGTDGEFVKPPLSKKPTLTLTSTKTPTKSTGKASGAGAKKAGGKPKQVIRLKSVGGEGGGVQSPSTPTGATRLKIKAKGKPPPRPLGVGYDSECEDAEEDPSMEEHLIFRMEPGPDCDYIRKAVEERMLGVPLSGGGADVNMRFFDKNGRRAVVSVQGRHYAAILVDLPCIIESMKSWDKRGWWKSADICQMLMVIGKVDKEEDAKETPLPTELDQETWQWPNGLTPPMYNVRKRRFRKRLSNRTIEAAEEEVNRLLKKDEEAITSRGSTSWEIINPRGDDESEASDQGGENDEDVDMFDEDDVLAQMEDDEADNEDELARQLEDLDEDDIGGDDIGAAENDAENATDQHVPPVSTPAGLEGDSMAIDSPTVAEASTEAEEAEYGDGEGEGEGEGDELGAGEEEGSDEEVEEQESSDDNDDDDDDNAVDAEEDEDAREKAQQLNDIKSELANAIKQIRQRDAQLQTVTAPIVRKKILGQRQEFERIAQVKRQELGLGEDDEVDLEGLDADDDA